MTIETAALRFVDGEVKATLDVRAYRLSAIKKAAYRVADRVTVILLEPTELTLPVALRFKPGTSEVQALEATRLFFQELLDQDLREAIAEETGPIRALILAQAFSKTDLIRRG